MEVSALTGQVSDLAHFMKYATLVGTVPVRRPPPPPPDVEEGKPAPPRRPPSTEPGLDQGQPGMVVEELTPEALVPVVVPEIEKQKARDEELRLQARRRAGPPRLTPPDLGTPLPPPLTRYYVVIGRNGGRRGASTPRLAVALRPAPPAPSQLTSTLAETYIELGWAPPEGLPTPVHKGTAVARPAAPAKPPAEPSATPPAEPPATPQAAPQPRRRAAAPPAAPSGADHR